jgi:hypothetical protein
LLTLASTTSSHDHHGFVTKDNHFQQRKFDAGCTSITLISIQF